MPSGRWACATLSGRPTTSPTGRLYIGDVGGNDYSTAEEEVHVGARGRQLRLAGLRRLLVRGNPAYTNPIYAYAHNGRDAAITGGLRLPGAASSRPSTRAATSSPTTRRTGSSG